MKCDGTRAETRFCLSAKRMSPFKSAGASVQSTTGRGGVRYSGKNAGYTMFRGSVKSTGYPLHSPVPHVPSHFNWRSKSHCAGGMVILTSGLNFLQVGGRLKSLTTHKPNK